MKLDAKTVARLVLPPGKADVITFDGALSGFAGCVVAVMRSAAVGSCSTKGAHALAACCLHRLRS